jgi:ribonuclease-3
MPRKKKPLLSIYWDCQNIKITSELADNLVKFAKTRGTISHQRAYSNWKRENVDRAKYIERLGFERIDIPDTSKNSVDYQLIVDATQEAFGEKSADIFIIVSGDGDFSGLLSILKAQGKKTVVFAREGGSSQSLLNLADEVQPIERSPDTAKLPIFRDVSLLIRALTHRSYVNEHANAGEDNERLEFLGDSVLNFLSSRFLFNRYPEINEAQLTRLRSALVDEVQLADFANYLEIGKQIRLGKGAIKDKGYNNESLLSDTFEAIVGGYFLDSGLDAVWEFIEPLFIAAAESFDDMQTDISAPILVDSKNRFQQWTLEHFSCHPEYIIVDQSGPDHHKEFTAEVQVQGKVYGMGRGRTKKEAEKRAAENGLKKVGVL